MQSAVPVRSQRGTGGQFQSQAIVIDVCASPVGRGMWRALGSCAGRGGVGRGGGCAQRHLLRPWAAALMEASVRRPGLSSGWVAVHLCREAGWWEEEVTTGPGGRRCRAPLTGKHSPAPRSPAPSILWVLSLSVASLHPPPSPHSLLWPWLWPWPAWLRSQPHPGCRGIPATAGRANTAQPCTGTAAQAGLIPASVMWEGGARVLTAEAKGEPHPS